MAAFEISIPISYLHALIDDWRINIIRLWPISLQGLAGTYPESLAEPAKVSIDNWEATSTG
jgi:hypothetical protein